MKNSYTPTEVRKKILVLLKNIEGNYRKPSNKFLMNETITSKSLKLKLLGFNTSTKKENKSFFPVLRSPTFNERQNYENSNILLQKIQNNQKKQKNLTNSIEDSVNLLISYDDDLIERNNKTLVNKLKTLSFYRHSNDSLRFRTKARAYSLLVKKPNLKYETRTLAPIKNNIIHKINEKLKIND